MQNALVELGRALDLICEYLWQFPRSDAVQVLAICGKLRNPDEGLEHVQTCYERDPFLLQNPCPIAS